MTPCRFRCGGTVSPDREAIGYFHCTRACIRIWKQQRLEEADIVLVLMPKQGFAPAFRSDVKGTGKSSGR